MLKITLKIYIETNVYNFIYIIVIQYACKNKIVKLINTLN